MVLRIQLKVTRVNALVDNAREKDRLSLEVIIGGLFLLLAIVIFITLVGNRLAPVIMPTGRRRIIAVGWIGGLAGSLMDSALWQLGPRVAEINLVAAFVGSALFILLLGLSPFIKILLGKT